MLSDIDRATAGRARGTYMLYEYNDIKLPQPLFQTPHMSLFQIDLDDGSNRNAKPPLWLEIVTGPYQLDRKRKLRRWLEST